MAGQRDERPWFLSGRSTSLRATAVQAWSRLAWRDLKYSSIIRPALVRADGVRFGLPRVCLWSNPGGFDPESDPFSLTVYRPHERGVEPVVRKATWLQYDDLRRLQEPAAERDMPTSFDPTFTVTDATVPGAALEDALRSAADIRLPLVGLTDPESVSTCHGSTGLTIYSFSQPHAKLSLEWSLDAPEEWQPAIAFARRLQAFLASVLEKRG